MRVTARRAALVALAAGLALLCVAEVALARPGGGQSFNGPPHSGGGSSSGGGSGGGAVVWLLVQLVLEYPQVGVPLLLLVGAIWVWGKLRSGSGQQDWSSAPSARRPLDDGDGGDDAGSGARPFGQPRAPAAASAPDVVERLRAADPDFSLVLFEDFLYALYAEAHAARGGGHLARLAPYLGEPARAALARHPAAEVKAIVVGSMRLLGGAVAPDPRGGPGARAVVRVAFEANYTEVDAHGHEQSYWVAEAWRLERALSARSRRPATSRTFGCPNCGAPLEDVRGRTCSHCQKVVDTGEFDWLVAGVVESAREGRGPMLTGTTEEEGTDEPTIVAPDARPRYAALCAKDPALTWPGLTARVGLIFAEFQVAWSSQDLTRVRPYLSDSLFQTQLYWVDTYKAAHLRNLTEGAHILTVQLARVVSDRFYDAITVRVFATGLDFTLDAKDHVVAGSRSKPREYSEYWTLIRGSARTGAPRTDPACPNCGAPLAINQAGHCTYCRAKVTAGDFDWVLSRIEQDEVYGR